MILKINKLVEYRDGDFGVGYFRLDIKNKIYKEHKPTQEEIAVRDTLFAKHKAKQYQRDRKAEYDKLNQFELQFDDSQDNGTRWVDAILEIKSKYPKPE
jgi:hypothetical protein